MSYTTEQRKEQLRLLYDYKQPTVRQVIDAIGQKRLVFRDTATESLRRAEHEAAERKRQDDLRKQQEQEESRRRRIEKQRARQADLDKKMQATAELQREHRRRMEQQAENEKAAFVAGSNLGAPLAERFAGLAKLSWPTVIYLYSIHFRDQFWVYVGKHEVCWPAKTGDCGVREMPDDYFGSGAIWNRAVRDLGIENAEWMVLEIVPAEFNAGLLEDHWIQWAKSFYGDLCLNGRRYSSPFGGTYEAEAA